MADKDWFTTADTALAAWLCSQGFGDPKTIQVITTDYPAVYLFEQSDALRQCARLWQTGEAIGNCNEFLIAYKILRERARASHIHKRER